MNTRQDPHTGQFAEGNPGRAKGSKNIRTLQWEELGKEITEANSARFNELLGRLWNSADVTDQLRAAELFLKVVEFFKPKLSRIQTPDLEPTYIVVRKGVIDGPVHAEPDNVPATPSTPI